MARGRRIEQEIRENRSDTRKLESYRVRVDSRPSRDFSFDGSVIEVGVTGEVYTRPLNDSLVFGHPADKHGFGRGVFGDQRGSWSKQTGEDSGVFTEGGRGAVVDALDGQQSGVDTVVIGSGTASPAATDTSLVTEEASTKGNSIKKSANETISFGTFRFHQDGGSVDEFGTEDQDGGLMASLTASGVSPTAEQEVRADIIMKFVGDGTSGAAITDGGEQSVADSIKTAAVTVGLAEIAIGTGTTAAAETDTSLEAAVAQKACDREVLTDKVRPFIKWYSDEPTGQPYDITELGVFDDSGALVLRAVFDPWTIDSEVEPTTGASIRVL